jgi:hypothetical protein
LREQTLRDGDRVRQVLENELRDERYRLQRLIQELEELERILIRVRTEEEEKIRVIELRIAQLL